MEEYKSFAAFYNEYMESFDFDEWYEYLLDLSKLETVEDKNILDLGCGGGNMGIYFIEAGANYTGVDLSDEMLVFFDEKAYEMKKRPRLINFDMVNMDSFKEDFDFIYSTGDSINYLDKDQLERIVSLCSSKLKSGKVFTFDCIMPNSKSIPLHDEFDLDDFVLTFDRAFVDDTFITDVTIDYEGEVFREHHTQYMYSPEYLTELLKKYNFDVDILEYLEYNHNVDNCEKFQVVATLK